MSPPLWDEHHGLKTSDEYPCSHQNKPELDDMTASARELITLLAWTVALSTLSACGWVDSTGKQLSDITVPDRLQNEQPLEVTENTTTTALLLEQGSFLYNWTWTADNKDEIYRCTNIDGFDINHAVTSLSEACTTPTDCAITISESVSMDGTLFTIKVPELKSPLAISYSLSTSGDDDDIVSRQQLICAVPVNDPPQAADDNYIVQRNTPLIVDAGDLDNLLSNDRDDTDFRNSQLQVDITPVKAPVYAALFNLDSHGGFIYQAMADIPVNESGYTEDSFVYKINDGTHSVNATVFIKIYGTNEAPEQRQQIPDVVFIAADGVHDSHIRQIDLSQYFWDPDGDKLTFQSSDFDSTFGLTLSDNGMLTADASMADVNQWRATVQASDGVESIQGTFVVTIRVPESIKLLGNNRQPTALDIKNRQFTGLFSYDVSTFFADSDTDDQLTFTARGLPVGVQIRADGVIEGVVDASNLGRSFVQVTAEDGYGGSVTDGFNLTLNL